MLKMYATCTDADIWEPNYAHKETEIPDVALENGVDNHEILVHTLIYNSNSLLENHSNPAKSQ
jgi:hypothetical protein